MSTQAHLWPTHLYLCYQLSIHLPVFFFYRRNLTYSLTHLFELTAHIGAAEHAPFPPLPMSDPKQKKIMGIK